MLLLYSIVNLTVEHCYAAMLTSSVLSLYIFPATKQKTLFNTNFFYTFLFLFHFCSQIFDVFFFFCCSQNRIFNSFSLYVSIQIIIIIKEGAMSERENKKCVFITPENHKMMLKCKFFLFSVAFFIPCLPLVKIKEKPHIVILG